MRRAARSPAHCSCRPPARVATRHLATSRLLLKLSVSAVPVLRPHSAAHRGIAMITQQGSHSALAGCCQGPRLARAPSLPLLSELICCCCQQAQLRGLAATRSVHNQCTEETSTSSHTATITLDIYTRTTTQPLTLSCSLTPAHCSSLLSCSRTNGHLNPGQQDR